MNKVVKRILIGTGVVLGTVVLAAGGYVGYVFFSYNRIGDADLTVDAKSQKATVEVGQTYSALSYNIGFGAYSQDFTFFMDTGYDDEGKATCGYWSKARSKDVVEFNTAGAIAATKKENADFIVFQEVDTNSTRSYSINQDTKIMEAYTDYDHVHAINFHTAFLPYPLYDMHGEVHAGLTTVSRYKITAAQRKQYTVSDGFSKFFDLDRCFSVSKVAVNNGKSLYIVNSHMSAYDEGGTIREKQVAEMNAFLKEKKEAGDYVIVGGDFNHDLVTFNPEFSYTDVNGHRAFSMTKKTPDWVSFYFNKEGKSPLTAGYKVVASDNVPTCRNNDIEYEPGKTFVCAVDGFIVSDNIEVVSHQNIQTQDSRKEHGNKGFPGFAYADHDPVKIEFKLL